MIITAYLVTSGLVDIGYQFYNTNESANGSRITAGVVDASNGWYSADATIPAGAVSVRWNSAGNATIIAREYFLGLTAPGTGVGQINYDSTGNVKVSSGTGANQIETISGGVKISAGGIVNTSFAAGAINKAALAADTGLAPATSGTAVSGGSNYIELAATASSVNDFYKNGIVFLTGGIGAGTFGICDSYNGTTKVATLSSPFVTTPNATTTYAILPLGSISASAPTSEEIAAAVVSKISSVTEGGGGLTGTEVGDAEFEQVPGGLNLVGVVGNDLTMDVYFENMNLTGYMFSGYVVIDPEPLLRTYPLTITNTDLPSGQIAVSLTKTQTSEIGPVSGKPWFIQWDGGSTQLTRNLLMGHFQLNRY